MTSHILPPSSQSADFCSCFLVVPLPLPLLLLGLHPLVLRGELWLTVARVHRLLHRSIHTLQHTQGCYVYVAGYDKKVVFFFLSQCENGQLLAQSGTAGLEDPEGSGSEPEVDGRGRSTDLSASQSSPPWTAENYRETQGKQDWTTC